MSKFQPRTWPVDIYSRVNYDLRKSLYKASKKEVNGSVTFRGTTKFPLLHGNFKLCVCVCGGGVGGSGGVGGEAGGDLGIPGPETSGEHLEVH